MIAFIKKFGRGVIAAFSRAGTAIRGWIARPRQKLIHLMQVEGEFPSTLSAKTLYVLTEDGLPWQAAMICPCGCGEVLDLNLLPDERPCWQFEADKHGIATLHPSIWRKIGCKSHFWLRDGEIVWV
jgi:hypothetical protein